MKIRVALAVLLLVSCAAAQSAPDWPKARAEMLQFLTDLVRIDTSNGNETRAANYIKSVLDREGIPSEIFEKVPGHGNIVARVKGNGSRQPILLMGHLDVVGVERDKWTVDPFAGVIKDGYMFGRGAADDKNIVAANLETILLLHRLKMPLDRDVIFLAEAGEEGTPSLGIEFMINQHWDKIACEFATTEGPNIRENGGKVQWVGIATAEKVPRGVQLIAHGTSGHASIPRPDDPITHLAAAVAKLGEWQTPTRLNDTTRMFFAELARISPAPDAWAYTHLDDPKAQEYLLREHPDYYSMVHTSIVPTILRGGFRENVIPARAEATLDIRALPDEDMSAFLAAMQRLVNDPAIEIVPPHGDLRPANPPSRTDTAMFRALQAAQQRVFPGVVTLPMEVPYATDMAQLRARGVQAYGFGPPAPPMTDPNGPRMHGNDERISIQALDQYLEFLYAAVLNVAAH